jgi:HTH-type transcriptional regulator/antitoxin HigA
MPVEPAFPALPDTYFKLVKRFPLTHLRDDAHFEAAREVMNRLLGEELDAGGQEYLDVLTDLVERYESEHERTPDASEADVLRLLMESNRLNQTTLAKRAGISQSTISAVLNGSRSLTKEQLVTLARFFNVAPAAFLPGPVR